MSMRGPRIHLARRLATTGLVSVTFAGPSKDVLQRLVPQLSESERDGMTHDEMQTRVELASTVIAHIHQDGEQLVSWEFGE